MDVSIGLPAPTPSRVHVYTDESGTNERYLVIGGLWISPPSEATLRQAAKELRHRRGLRNEMKWGKVSRSMLQAYKDFVDLFFAIDDVRFACIIIDNQLVDHTTYSKGDGDLSFWKFYYQLLLKRVETGREYYVFTDQRPSRNKGQLPALHTCLNHACDRDYGCRPVRTVQSRDSRSDDLIQLADVIIGAIGYCRAGHKTSPAKLELMRHIEMRLKFKLSKSTGPLAKRFNIWTWQPRMKPQVRKATPIKKASLDPRQLSSPVARMVRGSEASEGF